jgi:hypothetical protein
MYRQRRSGFGMEMQSMRRWSDSGACIELLYRAYIDSVVLSMLRPTSLQGLVVIPPGTKRWCPSTSRFLGNFGGSSEEIEAT